MNAALKQVAAPFDDRPFVADLPAKIRHHGEEVWPIVVSAVVRHGRYAVWRTLWSIGRYDLGDRVARLEGVRP